MTDGTAVRTPSISLSKDMFFNFLFVFIWFSFSFQLFFTTFSSLSHFGSFWDVLQGMAVPASLRLLGRAGGLENSDICGYYVHSGWNEVGDMTSVKSGSVNDVMFMSHAHSSYVIQRI